MRYKLRLTRALADFATVDIPNDFFIKPGDTILHDGKHHELKNIVRPTIDVLSIEQGCPTSQQMESSIAILILSDPYPLI